MRKARLRHAALALLIGLASACGSAASAQAADPDVETFYKSHPIDLIIPFNVGGGYDLYARLIAHHLPRYVPGSPEIVPHNQPGAGGLTAINKLYMTAPKDGSTMGLPPEITVIEQIMGEKNIAYDVRRFQWIGRMSTAIDVFYVWHTARAKTFDDLYRGETLAGATGGRSNNILLPELMNRLLGTKIKLIRGFPGSVEVDRAMERGEVEMAVKPWQGVKSGEAIDWVRDGKITLLAQVAVKRSPELQGLPTLYEMAKTDDERQIMRVFFDPSEVGRSVVMPPGVPANRVAAMRAGFAAMLKDPGFLADAAKLKLSLAPMVGDDLQKAIEGMFAIPPATLAKAKELYYAP